MFLLINKIVLSMAILRLCSGTIEVLAALLMIKTNQVEKALLINSGLALVGPTVLVLTTSLGLIGIADRLSYGKIFWIALGVCCIFMGVRK